MERKKFLNLQDYIHFLEQKNELKRIKVEVDSNLEITEIVSRVIKDEGPALLFENVKNSKFPLLVNLFGSKKRIFYVLDAHPYELGERFSKLFENFSEKINLKNLLEGFKIFKNFSVRIVSPPENILKNLTINDLPILKCWPLDGGKFITFGLTLTENKKTNLGVYRIQVVDSDRLILHWQIEKGGAFHYEEYQTKKLPMNVVIIIGADPSTMLSACFPLPENIEELKFSGFLRNSPTDVFLSKTSSLPIPESFEFVIEGVIYPNQKLPEGPFGDHFGYYSHKSEFPVFNVKSIFAKKQPIYVASIVGKPPMEDKFIGETIQEFFLPIIKLLKPEISDLWAYYQAGFHNLLVVSIKQRYKKEFLKTVFGLLGFGQLSLTKVIVVVNDGVNVKNIKEVFSEIAKNFQPKNDFYLFPDTSADTLDFTSGKTNLGSKMVIDASKDSEEKNLLENIKVNIDNFPEITSYRFLVPGILVIKVSNNPKNILKKIIDTSEELKLVVAVSEDIDIYNDDELIWGIFTRFDCQKDIFFSKQDFDGIKPVFGGVMAIDATLKKDYPPIVTMDDDIKRLVDKKWKEYFQK